MHCSAARDSSNLLAHEAAFALGQMQDAEAIPALEAVLKDLSLHPIVRHEVVIHKSLMPSSTSSAALSV
jgi:HEAT repeat protein